MAKPNRASAHNGRVEQQVATTTLGDGTKIAYALAGRGPLLVYVPGWLTHLELSWAIAAERRFYEALASGRTLLRYDKPGCGLSQRTERPYTLELELETLDAVLHAVGADRYDLFGVSLGSVVAAEWAAKHPEYVRRMVLYGGWARGADLASPAIQQHVLALVTEHWGLGSDVLSDIFAPGADAQTRAAFTSYQRESASAETARDLLDLCYRVDISSSLNRIKAPTLLLHRDRDRAVPIEQGRALADGIAGARLEVLSGRAHLLYVGDLDVIARSTRRFLGLPTLRRRLSPVLTPRQIEVASLVASGLTNREIADQLHITERSAESHVERIRNKLGFRSRSQIAAWYTSGNSAS